MRSSLIISSRAILSVFAGVLAASSQAGPLSPPAGPIGSTPGPEPRTALNSTNTPGDADSVFRITQPGSYYLTKNLSGIPGKGGIEIAASDVTVDLMGFDVRGTVGTTDGIFVSLPDLDNITIENGMVGMWGEDGVDLVAFAPKGCAVRNIRSHDNTHAGIRVRDHGMIAGCSSRFNAGIGYDCYSGVQCVDSSAEENFGNGFDTSDSCELSGCRAMANHGFGIRVGVNSVVDSCVATVNQDAGIGVGSGSIVRGCTVQSNTDGISAGGTCLIVGNNCAGNIGVAGAGIRVSSAGDTRVEGNNCAQNTVGIQISSAGNFIVRNTCAGNGTNWSIAGSNTYGPIVDRSAPGAAAAFGNSAPSTLGTTDPNANFTY